MFQKDIGACGIYREGDCCDGELVEGLGLHERCHRGMAEWCGEEEGGGGTEISRRLALGILRLVILQFPSKLLFLYFSPDLSGLVRHSRHLDLLNRGHPPLVLQHSVLHESELWIEIFACIALNPLRFLYGLT